MSLRRFVVLVSGLSADSGYARSHAKDGGPARWATPDEAKAIWDSIG